MTIPAEAAADRAMRAYIAAVKAIDTPISVLVALIRYDEARAAEEHASTTVEEAAAA